MDERYECCRCHQRFEKPDIAEWNERLPFGFIERWREKRCPYCGHFELIEIDEEDVA